MDQQAEKDKAERVTGLGRKTREEIAKWNQMTTLRFQTGGRHQTSPASLRGCHVNELLNKDHPFSVGCAVSVTDDVDCL